MSSEESVSLATKSDSYSSTRVHVLVLVGRARRLTAERVARPFIMVEGFKLPVYIHGVHFLADSRAADRRA